MSIEKDVSEFEPFLRDSDEEQQRDQTKISSKSSYKSIVCHVILVGLYTLFFFLFRRSETQEYVLLSDALQDLKIHTKPKMSITTGQSPWVGEPGGPADYAWHELVGNTSIRVTDDELGRNGNHQSSVPLPVGGGNLVWMGVYHQIHCLKQFRHLNYLNFYHPNMTHDERYHMEVHVNHCIEYLRQAVMCNPDTSLTTLVWTDNNPKPVLDVKPFERVCVDWELLMESVTPRVVSLHEVDSLVNPKL